MSAELTLGFDVGTFASKGVLTTPDGQVVTVAEREHGLDVPRPGWAEHDPEGVWWRELCEVARELLEGRDPSAVKAVGVSGLGPDLVLLDADGRPLRPAILYGIDTRAEREIAELDERIGREEILSRTGAVLTTQAVGPKLAWVARHEPEVLERVRYATSASGFLVLRLTGRHVLDPYTASSFNPLYDVRTGEWIPELAEGIVDPALLPEIAPASEIVGRVTAQAAEATGLAQGTPVAAGTIDAAAEAVSSGAVGPGDLMLMYGSTFFLILTTEDLRLDERFWAIRNVLPGRFCLAAGMATSGALTRWFCDEFLPGTGRAESYELMAREAATEPPGANGLVALPYFSGERTPIHDPDARGVLAGLTLAHSRGAIYRALLEGTAFSVAHNLEAMDEAGAGAARIVVSGGGTQNALWMQMVSDASGLVQEVPAVTLGACYGDAFLAAMGVGLVDERALSEEWVEIERRVEPDPEVVPVYERLYRVYRDLYEATKDQVHALARET